MSSDIEQRREITFSQSEGLAELPRPLDLGEMPRAFRVELWSMIHRYMSSKITIYDSFIEPWNQIAGSIWVRHFQKPIDEFPRLVDFMETLKSVFLQDKYNEVLDLMTAILRECHSHGERILFDVVSQLLGQHQMAYHLDTNGPPTFMPQTSPQEGEAIRDAMKLLTDADSGMDGARAHLKRAAEEINSGRFADAIRESIHAVESVAKVINEDAKSTLGPALKELERRELLTHKALRSGFEKLYGYTSDENGLRHSLLDKGEANVDLEEAVFMFGACASFCGYLCRKQAKF